MSNVSFTRAAVSAAILSLFAVPGFCTSPNGGTSVPLGVSSTWTGDTTNHPISDNSGRQLAVAFPVIPHTLNVKMPTINGTVSKTSKKNQVIKFTVPASVDETADVCRVGLNRVSVVGQQKAKELCTWALAVHKQMTQSPLMTPIGGPYPTPAYAQTKLFYTNEGRLKTVVKR